MPKIKDDQLPTTIQGRLREYATQQTSPLVVDEENGVIKDVLVLGNASRGMGVYSPAVMQTASRLYEGQPAYIGHTRDGSNPDFMRQLGAHRNPHMSPEGLRTDFHYNRLHEAASQLVWNAKNAPQNCGFSHDADCTWELRGGKRIVKSIDKVYSCDLVTRTGTTGGLWEEEISDPDIRSLAEAGLAAMDNARSIIFAPDIDIATRRTRLLESVNQWRTELETEITGGTTALQEEELMDIDWKEVTRESLTANRPDLVAVLTGTDEVSRLTEEAKTLKDSVAAKDAELTTLKAEKATRVREEEITAELKAAKFPTGDAKLFSAKFQEQLRAAPDKPARDALIKDRMELATGRLTEAGTPPPLTEIRDTNTAAPKADSSYDRLFGKAA